ncbi:MAG: GAF and ANTAR domain-containing protein [Jatrophihabitantaceae bacterium]
MSDDPDPDGMPSALVVCRAFLTRAPLTGAAFTVMSSDVMRDTVCASDEVIAEITAVQYRLGEGPALAAFTTRRPVLIPDLAAPAAAARWPVFTAEAAALPVGALFAFPMQLGAITVGVCDGYRTQAGALTGPQVATALRGVDVATVSLLSVRASAPGDDPDPNWLDGHGSNRQRVHQATGMLVAQLGVSAEQAFARLRAHAYTDGRSLDEIAADIVERRLRLDSDPTQPDPT